MQNLTAKYFQVFYYRVLFIRADYILHVALHSDGFVYRGYFGP